MESSTRLGNHQIDNRCDRIKNSLFVGIARLRNRLMFYRLPVDIRLYKSFLEGYYLKRGEVEKEESYPLSKTKDAET
jgi:hypothetical protein